MSVVIPELPHVERSRNWRWWVCCLLLLATMINYMDRLTLNLLKVHILADLRLDNRDYGDLEAYFGLAFAAGAILFGFMVDRWNVFWVYPLALIGWSLAGIASGFAQSFWGLLLCRMFLGLAEAANWPCALRITQRILPPGERSMGNSILQSGAAIGAIVIPLVLFVLFDEARPQTWRLPFFVVGAVGMLWVFLWLAVVRPADLALERAAGPDTVGAAALPPLPRGVFVRRFAVLIVLVVTINLTWHFLRAWLPSFLMEKHHFTQNQTNFFSAGYYVFTDLGALTAGFAALRLVQMGGSVHASRRLVFLVGAMLAALCLGASFLPAGWALVGLLFLVGFGALGVYPCYYSFSQDLTARNQGKVTGALGACCWGAMYIWQQAIGQWVHYTGSYTLPFIIAGVAPLIGFAALLLLWGPTPTPAPAPLPAPDEGLAPALHAGPVERIVTAGEKVKT